MAFEEVFKSKNLSIEVQIGTDDEKGPIYRKKSLGKLKENATTEEIEAVVLAIVDVLSKDTRHIYTTEVTSLD